MLGPGAGQLALDTRDRSLRRAGSYGFQDHHNQSQQPAVLATGVGRQASPEGVPSQAPKSQTQQGITGGSNDSPRDGGGGAAMLPAREASVSNGPAGLNASDAKLRALEHRLTGAQEQQLAASRPGRPPVSPRNLHRGNFQTMPSGGREVTNEASQPGGASARRLSLGMSDDPDASQGTAVGSFGVVSGHPAAAAAGRAALEANGAATNGAAAAAPSPEAASAPNLRKRKSGEAMPPPPATAGRKGSRRLQSASPSISAPAQPEQSGGAAAGSHLEGGSSRERGQKTPPTGKRLHQLQQKNTINTYFGRRGGSSGAGNENSPIVLSGPQPGASESDVTDAGGSPEVRRRGSGSNDAADDSIDMPASPPKGARGTAAKQQQPQQQPGGAQQGRRGSRQASAEAEELARQLHAAEAQVAELQARLAADSAAAQQTATAHTQEVESLRQAAAAAQSEALATKAQLGAATTELQATKSLTERREARGRKLVSRLTVQRADAQREASLLRLRLDGCRLGSLTVTRNGSVLGGLQEGWEPGQAFRDMEHRLQAVVRQRADIEEARKLAKKRLPPPGHPLSAPSTSPQPNGTASVVLPSGEAFISPEDYVAQDEIYKVRLGALKREEDALQRERETLEAAKLAHIKELRRLRDEGESRFRDRSLLHQRYRMGNLLGKGGFSDVYLAVDLVEWREVAVKVHQLNPQWNEHKRESYVKHAVREYNIQRELVHPRIVRLLDLFEIDAMSFATVLEVAPGGDLASHLQLHPVLPEKEARVIAAQIAAGLAYMNGPAMKQRIIHYDLKPANILFDQWGEVKITDFGLSKQVAEECSQGMELTSQGAGTYWYLPPECFEANPLITNKVDVFSLGVILYQMLFGRRPFGEGQSQDKILRDGVMLHAPKQLTFPAKPAMSQEAKDFLSQCLAYKSADRLDVHACAAHPYLALRRPATAAQTRAAAAKAEAAAREVAAAAAAGSGGTQATPP